MLESVLNTILDVIFWLYFSNAILLIIHEIESAYWKEWELFKIKGGLTFFLILHVPIIGLIMFGLIEMFLASQIGLIISIILSLGGLFAFSIHVYFIKKGNDEFKLPISIIILCSILIISLA